MDDNTILDAEDGSEYQSQVSNLQAQIDELTARNQSLENRNITLCNIIKKMHMNEPSPDYRIRKVNERSSIIMRTLAPKISNIKKLNMMDEENPEVYEIVDILTRAEIFADIITENRDTSSRCRPVPALSDFMPLYKAKSGTLDVRGVHQLCLQFSHSFIPQLTQRFRFLKAETKHPDTLTAYIGFTSTLILFHLWHLDSQVLRYPLDSPPWARYKDAQEYKSIVVDVNAFDLLSDITPMGREEDQELNLEEQRKRLKQWIMFCKNNVC